jgi:GNAT superfamily N-acetyltransferase
MSPDSSDIVRARAIESSRPLKERTSDEATTEPTASSFEEWLANPGELDIPGVDVKSPLTFNKEEHFASRGAVDGKLEAFDERGEYVGHIGYTWTPCDFHLELLHIKPEFRGKGYAAFMLREFIDTQDKLCVPASLSVVPFAGEKMPGHEEYEKQMQVLKGLYGSFGFRMISELEPVGKDIDIMKRMPVCRTKRENERLSRECGENLKGQW